MCGDNWISQAVLPELAEKSRGKIQSYYCRRLNTISENYAHLFLCEMTDEGDLERNWKHIVDLVAVHVQSEVKNLLQRSNFYIWFFVKGKVSRSFRKSIEDDTFSSKKYVVPETESRSEQERIDLIERKLFAYSCLQEPLRQKMIKKVILQNFRAYKGSRTFDFSAGDAPARLVVLYAPNGMGKTSFFDAVEWTFTESVNRFGQLKNKNIEGAVLRNTEADPWEEASVAIYMDDGEWVKREVPALNGKTKRDTGKGKLRFSKGSSLKPLIGEDREKRWANLMLQHHKIDGFIAAANPQELYREWCGLWDPTGEERERFEQSYRESRRKREELDQAGERYAKAEVEYHALDGNRKFVGRLAEDVEKFNGLPWEAGLENPDFSILKPDEYMKWCDSIHGKILPRQNRRNDYEEEEKYIERWLEEDVGRYNALVKRKRNNDLEIRLVNEKIKRCQRKMELLALRTDLLAQMEVVRQEVKRFSALEDRGQKWYARMHQYFYAPVRNEFWTRNREEAEHRLREAEMIRDNIRLSMAEKRAAIVEQEQYNALLRHVHEIEALEIKKKELRMEAEEARGKRLALEKQLSELSHKHDCLKEKYLYRFEETVEQYRQGGLKCGDEDRKIQEIRTMFVGKLQEYFRKEDRFKEAGREYDNEENVAERLRQITEEARILIDENHLSRCPVCQTLFEDSVMLMQSTYRASSTRGTRLKEEILAASQQLAEIRESAEALIAEHNAYITYLISAIGEEERTKTEELEDIRKQCESILRQMDEQDRQIGLLKKMDWEQGLYVEHTREGIEAWHQKQMAGQDRELERQEEIFAGMEKKIADERAYIEGLEKERKREEERFQSIALQLREDITLMQGEKDTILQYTFEDIMEINGEAKKEKRNLTGKLRECDGQLEQYRDVEESMHQILMDNREQFQRDNDEIISKSSLTADRIERVMPLSKEVRRMEAFIEETWREEAEEKKRRVCEQRQQMELSLELLQRMQYNREMENYFANYRILERKMEECRSVQEECRRKCDAAEEEYRAARDRIENSLKSFFDDFPINDIYEKLEPHDTLKKLICEFGFNKEDKPELTFKAVGEDNKKYSPEWYFSTAQLNVVAFSVFLGRALQAKEAPIQTIFIDDPVGHFDEMNVVCFVDLLRNIVENTGKQLIISTHEERVFGLLQRKLPKTEYPVCYIDFRESSTLRC